MSRKCPFCSPIPAQEIVVASPGAVALWDRLPVTCGHVLIASNRHVADFFDLTEAEQLEVLRLADIVQRTLMKMLGPIGFNVGWNIGSVAGQTEPHSHMHMIPRRQDCDRSGIRFCRPGRRNYADMIDSRSEYFEEMRRRFAGA